MLGISCALFLVSGLSVVVYGQTDDQIRQQIDTFVNTVMQCRNIPGFSLAVARDEETFYTQGYGVKDIVTSEPVTNQTMFVLASTTKAFAATLIAHVLREYAYTMNTRVKDILGSWFHLSDPYRTQEVTLRDLLAHRTSFPGNNPARIYGFSRRELLTRMRFMNFTGQFRDSYKYNNLMYGLATHVLEVLRGQTWEDVAYESLFRPLSMTQTTFVQLARDRFGEFAKCYQSYSGGLREVSIEAAVAYYSSISSPGGIATNAVDMSKWLLMLLNNGRAPDGSGVINHMDIATTWKGVMAYDRDNSGVLPQNPVPAFVDSYALGWNRGIYRGYSRMSHTGSITAYRSQVDILPGAKIGVFTATNRADDIRQYVSGYVMDLLLGYTPWFNASDVCALDVTDYGEQGDEGDFQKYQVTRTFDDSSIDKLSTPKDLNQYAGRYGNFGYGNLTFDVNQTSNQLMMHYGNFTWALNDQGSHTLQGYGLEPFWYWQVTVVFASDDPATSCHVDFETEPQWVRFARDLDIDTLPPPPEICPPLY